MAVSKIERIEIIGLEEDKEKLLSLLQKMGVVDIRRVDFDISPGQISVSGADILELEEAISYLGSFRKPPNILESIVTFKPLIYEEQLKEIVANFDYKLFLKRLAELRNHFKNLIQHKEKLLQEGHLLAPWLGLAIPLDGIHSTQNCGILLGVLRTNDYKKLIDDCKSETIYLFCETISQNKANTYLLIIYLNQSFEQLEAVLKKYHFNFATLSRHKATVKDRLFEINREVMVLDDQIEDVKKKIIELSNDKLKLMAVHDYLYGINRIKEADGHLVKQRYSFLLNGWIKAKDIMLLKEAISDKFREVAIFISEPKEGEEIPIDLENSRIIQPFEFITKIYGLPKYNELDPTPFLAPFFFLYFGFCVSDVGYGIMLVLISWFALKKFRLGPQGMRFFKLFLYCGISTIMVGALTGSYFGNLIDIVSESSKVLLPIKKLKDSLILFDPLKNPTRLLGIALSFGIIQVWFGNIVAAIGNIKNRRYLDVLLDQVTMLLLLFGLTGLGLIFLKLLDNKNMAWFKYSTLIGAIALIATQGRSEKGLGSKIFFGCFVLYSSLSGYLSDILSYSRLWALGLVTSVMANTINLVSIQFTQLIVSVTPFISRISFIKTLISGIILIAIFSLGHIVSFFMNLLGAFVHPVRLQFVEFFSKFFKGGGGPFKPFKIESKYTDIRRAKVK